MRVLTLASPGSLPRARALSRSLREHEPRWTHEVLLLGTEQLAVSLAAQDQTLSLAPLVRELDVDIEALLALHDEQELTTLLLPSLLLVYTRRSPEPVLHLPSSVWVLGSLEPVSAALESAAVMLVPRCSVDPPDDGLQPTREQLERTGRIEQGMIGVRGGDEAEAFLAWWHEHVERSLGSLDARKAGDRPEDRPWLARFLELAPARFSTAVLDDPGCNLSKWNLHSRSVGRTAEDEILVDGRWAARFLDLPGFEPERPHRLSADASRARVSRSPVLHELAERYAHELRAGGWSDLDLRGEVGRRLTDGLVYDDSMRSIYASAVALGVDFGDLFSDGGGGAFLEWLAGPAPRGGAHGINRYVFHRVARERPDVVRAYPDLDGPDGAEYVAWCWAFGRDELAIPEGLMPPRPGRARVGPSPAPHELAGPKAVAQSRRMAREPDEASPRPAPDGQAQAGSGELAVRLTGYLSHALGLGAAGRGYAQALRAAGVPVSTVTVPLHHLALPVALDAGYGRHGFEDLVHEGAHGFEIVAVNADELPDFVTRLGEGYFEGPRIGIWGWETNTIPARWQRAFSLIDEIWVYSRYMADNIGAAAPVPVLSLPPPVEVPAVSPAPLRLGVPEGFLFLFVFDYLSTIQRKNPVGLIEAFKLAFPAGGGPQLLIKTINGPLRPLAEEEVLWAAHGRPDVHVVDRSLSGAELASVMAACDCYVSLHKAEGFGLTLAEAMALGKPVIATNYSGNVDFMNEQNSYLVDYSIGRVGAECEIYPPEGEWAEPDVEQAARLMRRVVSAPDEARTAGARAAHDIRAALSAARTGAAMRKRLEELARSERAGRRAGRSPA